jgi:predicted transcriptional regulator
MVYEPWRTCNHIMGSDAVEIFEQVPGLLQNERKKEELFKMMQKEDENLEEFVERLQYNLQRSSHPNVSKDIIKNILLK